MKRIVVCCDGTWQDSSRTFPTNVAKLYNAVKRTDANLSQPQIVEYSPGIGSGSEWVSRVGGGAFGWGIDENIKDVYRRLCQDYDEGDEIYLFGFSRGAYTVRSLAGLMRVAGGLLPSKEALKVSEVYDIYRSSHDMARKERAIKALGARIRPAKVTVLGCWDTVGSLGIPRTLPLLSQLLNKKYEFHDCQLSNIIEHALHAVAIDENRKVFDYTPMEQSQTNIAAGQTLHQVRFPGDHGAIGGGSPESVTLADGALLWMIETIRNTLNLGLEFDLSQVEYDPNAPRPADPYSIHPQPTTKLPKKPESLLFRLTGLAPRTIPDQALLHDSTLKRWQVLGKDYRPGNIPSALVTQLQQYATA
jgi:uncharacterized protein (DUF2235 family)